MARLSLSRSAKLAPSGSARATCIAKIILLSFLSSAACGESTCPAGERRIGDNCVDSDAIQAEVCYLDHDRDGAGAGEPVDCEIALDALHAEGASAPMLSRTDDDCDDSDAARGPAQAERCDGVDNNCNGEVDEGARNVCGGVCVRVLPELGSACQVESENGCAGSGSYVCADENNMVCLLATRELCGDGLDNDCDGQMDEADAVDAVTWYQDCDGDGYAATTEGSVSACEKPANLGGCGWTDVKPDVTAKQNWDCNDASAEYSPKATYAIPSDPKGSWDLNCDGGATSSPEFAVPANSSYRPCGVQMLAWANNEGACPSSGNCLAWLTSAGRFTNVPSQSCPDTPYRLASVYSPFDDLGYMCEMEQYWAPAWACR